MKKKSTGNRKGLLKIHEMEKVKKQYEAGVSIRAISQYWGIPYATLYRALKGRGKVKKSL